jgi:mRNA interferase YafQ
MYQLEQTGKFKKDIKQAKKRGLNMHLLDEVITLLVEKGSLPQKNKPHKLTGTLKDFGNAISNPIGC